MVVAVYCLLVRFVEHLRKTNTVLSKWAAAGFDIAAEKPFAAALLQEIVLLKDTKSLRILWLAQLRHLFGMSKLCR